ncbi:hypothetical protein DFH09DRAFT_1453062 [Mycena vulgaris]|nr:hypothetical protein DFH09DRAFT_1453062 [Mycena vulgaris]
MLGSSSSALGSSMACSAGASGAAGAGFSSAVAARVVGKSDEMNEPSHEIWDVFIKSGCAAHDRSLLLYVDSQCGTYGGGQQACRRGERGGREGKEYAFSILLAYTPSSNQGPAPTQPAPKPSSTMRRARTSRLVSVRSEDRRDDGVIRAATEEGAGCGKEGSACKRNRGEDENNRPATTSDLAKAVKNVQTRRTYGGSPPTLVYIARFWPDSIPHGGHLDSCAGAMSTHAAEGEIVGRMKKQGVQLDWAASKEDFYDDAEYIQFAVRYRFQRTTEDFAGSTAPRPTVTARRSVAFAAARLHLTKTERGVPIASASKINTISNEGSDQILAESDGLIESHGIADRNPRRGDIDFLRSDRSPHFAVAISPPFLRRSTTLGARSDPPTLGLCLGCYWMAMAPTTLLYALREARLLFWVSRAGRRRGTRYRNAIGLDPYGVPFTIQSFILRGHYLKPLNFSLTNSQIFWRSYQHLGIELGAQDARSFHDPNFELSRRLEPDFQTFWYKLRPFESSGHYLAGWPTTLLFGHVVLPRKRNSL